MIIIIFIMSIIKFIIIISIISITNVIINIIIMINIFRSSTSGIINTNSNIGNYSNINIDNAGRPAATNNFSRPAGWQDGCLAGRPVGRPARLLRGAHRPSPQPQPRSQPQPQPPTQPQPYPRPAGWPAGRLAAWLAGPGRAATQ